MCLYNNIPTRFQAIIVGIIMFEFFNLFISSYSCFYQYHEVSQTIEVNIELIVNENEVNGYLEMTPFKKCFRQFYKFKKRIEF